VWRPGTEVISTKSAGKAEDGRVGEGGRVRAEEWDQYKRVWSAVPTIWMGRQEGQ